MSVNVSIPLLKNIKTERECFKDIHEGLVLKVQEVILPPIHQSLCLHINIIFIYNANVCLDWLNNISLKLLLREKILALSF